MNKDYDLAIVGGGAAGLIAAPFAVQFGARVAFIEKDRIGGDCTWTGCVPSKTLLKAAKLAHQIRTADSTHATYGCFVFFYGHSFSQVKVPCRWVTAKCGTSEQEVLC
jgi:pyruvate/2-oxoglutarate dehydrogenase complex dihydrolipoamide dehydrogenase (E3) component